MTLPAASNAALAAPALPALVAPGRRRAAQAALLALVMLVYEVAARFELRSFDARFVLDLATTAVVLALVAWLLLWVIDTCGERLSAWPTATRLVASALCGALVAWSVMLGSIPLRMPFLNLPEALDGRAIALFLLLWSSAVSVLLVAVHEMGARSRAAAQALHDAELNRLRLEREADSARLQVLQAQIEPHFIFNALANVRRLLRTDAAGARALLDDLLRYLEQALPSLREERVPLGREAELVRAYLAVHQVRMGARLAFEVDVPPALAAQPVPSMILLTLVENALKHGLQPLVEGGAVRVAAQAQGKNVVLSVADTGRGMGSGSGHGTGLANIRARLRSLHGDAASLALAVNEPRGVRATVTLPLAP